LPPPYLTWQGKQKSSLYFPNFCHRVTVETATWAELPFRSHGAPWQPSAHPRLLAATAEITWSEVALSEDDSIASGRARWEERMQFWQAARKCASPNHRPPRPSLHKLPDDCSIHKTIRLTHGRTPASASQPKSQKASSAAAHRNPRPLARKSEVGEGNTVAESLVTHRRSPAKTFPPRARRGGALAAR
jgi:hypothetical protein